jgi:hypothetical protein
MVKEDKMNDQEIIEFMIKSINETNRLLAEQSGMTPEQIDQQVEMSKQGMNLIVTALYAKMKEVNIIA